MDDLKEMLEKGKFVEIGQKIEELEQKIKESKQRVKNLRRNRKHNEASEIEKEVKELEKELEEIKKFINDAFKEFKGKAEQFLDLTPEERLKMAFVLAAKTTVVEGMKTTQIRKILSMSNGIFRGIKTRRLRDISPEIAKMRYILAYTASRHRNQITPILEVSDKILPKLTVENYETFHEFLQAIVAYHKFLGGRD